MRTIYKNEIRSAYHNLRSVFHDCFNNLSAKHIIKTKMEFVIDVSSHNMSAHKNALRYFQSTGVNEAIVSFYNNLTILYCYHYNDYINA